MKKTNYYCETCNTYFETGDALRNHLNEKDEDNNFKNIGHIGIDNELQKEFDKIWE